LEEGDFFPKGWLIAIGLAIGLAFGLMQGLSEEILATTNFALATRLQSAKSPSATEKFLLFFVSLGDRRQE
jgi:hypothetical protein